MAIYIEGGRIENQLQEIDQKRAMSYEARWEHIEMDMYKALVSTPWLFLPRILFCCCFFVISQVDDTSLYTIRIHLATAGYI